MYIEARKIHLIKEILQVESEAVLSKVESILKQSKPKKDSKKPSAHDLVGVFSKKDAALMTQAIEDGCEQIHADDWK